MRKWNFFILAIIFLLNSCGKEYQSIPVIKQNPLPISFEIRQEQYRVERMSDEIIYLYRDYETADNLNDLLLVRIFIYKLKSELEKDDEHSILKEKIAAKFKEISERKLMLPSKQINSSIIPSNSSFIIPRNKIIEKEMNRWLNKSRNTLINWLKRKNKFAGIVLPLLRKHQVPEELIYLPIVESGYRPKALSRAGAYGLWQFMPGTAKSHGLKKNFWVDERACPYKSTEAACKFLKTLYRIFNSWELALASYNAGSGYISNQIKKQNSRDFWQMDLYKETSSFVPRFYAITILGEYKEAFNLDINDYKDFKYDSLLINSPLDFTYIADACNTTSEEISELNPELNHSCTPPFRNGYYVKIPHGKADDLRRFLLKLDKDKWWLGKKVIYKNSLSVFARKYKIPLKVLEELNPNPSKGDKILIPVGKSFKKITTKKRTSPKKNKKKRKSR